MFEGLPAAVKPPVGEKIPSKSPPPNRFVLRAVLTYIGKVVQLGSRDARLKGLDVIVAKQQLGKHAYWRVASSGDEMRCLRKS